MSSTLFVSMFAIGLATSFHCISMCGPMVVTYAVKTDGSDSWSKRVSANVAYQGAKLVSYLLVGLALGAVGSAINLNAVRPWVMFVAGVFMIILGLGMTGKVPWAARVTPRPPRALFQAISKLRRKAVSDAAAGDDTLTTPIAFGLLTGLMPCAPLMAAELTAASSGSVASGGLVMLAFGLGTMPLLFAFGTASSLIPVRWKRRMNFVLAFVVIALGLVFLNRTAMIMGFPVNSHSIQAAVAGTGPAPATQAASNVTTAADGVTEVRMTVANGRFQPSDLQVPADRPVRLIVTRPNDDPCSAQLLFPRLGISKNLTANGETIVDLPAAKAGAYTMTCGMGMLSGRLLVGTGAAGGGGLPAWAWIALTLATVGGAGWLAMGLRPDPAPAVEGPPAKAPSPADEAPKEPSPPKVSRPAGGARKNQSRSRRARGSTARA